MELISLQLVKECLKEAFSKSSEEKLLAGWKDESDHLLNNDSTEAELNVTNPGAVKQNEKEKHNSNYKFKFSKNTITNYFTKKSIFNFENEMKALEKERRLEIQRRKKLEWKSKRETYEWKKAVKVMLLEMLLDNVVDQGNRSVEKSCKEVAKEVIETSLGVWTIREGLRRKQIRKRVKMAEKKKTALLEEIDRRKKMKE